MKWFITIMAILILIVWFYNLPGARQLNIADQLYATITLKSFQKSEMQPTVHRNIIYDEARNLKLNIWSPPEEQNDAKNQPPRPVLYFAYGGSWRSGARADYDFLGKAFAQKGFITVIADYRLVDAGGHFPTFARDTAKSLAWTVDNIADYGGDTNNIFISGHSAGAYNIMIVALDPRWLKEVGKDRRIIKGAIGLAGPYDFVPLKGEATIAAFGKYQPIETSQPIHHLHQAAAHMSFLFLHGKQDDTVKPRNSHILDKRLKAMGLNTHKILYQDMGHLSIIMAISRPFRTRGPVLDDMARWINTQSSDTETAQKGPSISL